MSDIKKTQDFESKIIIFPEYDILKTEVEKLRTEISMLLLERDELQLVICKNIETAYILALGGLEYKIFELNCKLRRIKRKMEIIQMKKNRQEEVVVSVIENILDEEFEEFQKQLDEQIDKMNKAIDHSKACVMTDEETREIKKLYRSIVKVLHPDLNINATPAQIQLFHNAVLAYENGDLFNIRIIAEMVVDNFVLECNESALSILVKDKERLSEISKNIQEQIENIKSEYPYTMKKLLDDPEQLEKKRKEFEELIYELKNTYNLYDEKIKEMLRL